MADKRLKHRELMKILRRYGVEEDTSRGKGSHRYLRRRDGEDRLFTPVGVHGKNHEHSRSIVKSIRRALHLSESDGVSDAEFYGD